MESIQKNLNLLQKNSISHDSENYYSYNFTNPKLLLDNNNHNPSSVSNNNNTSSGGNNSRPSSYRRSKSSPQDRRSLAYYLNFYARRNNVNFPTDLFPMPLPPPPTRLNDHGEHIELKIKISNFHRRSTDLENKLDKTMSIVKTHDLFSPFKSRADSEIINATKFTTLKCPSDILEDLVTISNDQDNFRLMSLKKKSGDKKHVEHISQSVDFTRKEDRKFQHFLKQHYDNHYYHNSKNLRSKIDECLEIGRITHSKSVEERPISSKLTTRILKLKNHSLNEEKKDVQERIKINKKQQTVSLNDESFVRKVTKLEIKLPSALIDSDSRLSYSRHSASSLNDIDTDLNTNNNSDLNTSELKTELKTQAKLLNSNKPLESTTLMNKPMSAKTNRTKESDSNNKSNEAVNKSSKSILSKLNQIHDRIIKNAKLNDEKKPQEANLSRPSTGKEKPLKNTQLSKPKLEFVNSKTKKVIQPILTLTTFNQSVDSKKLIKPSRQSVVDSSLKIESVSSFASGHLTPFKLPKTDLNAQAKPAKLTLNKVDLFEVDNYRYFLDLKTNNKNSLLVDNFVNELDLVSDGNVSEAKLKEKTVSRPNVPAQSTPTPPKTLSVIDLSNFEQKSQKILLQPSLKQRRLSEDSMNLKGRRVRGMWGRKLTRSNLNTFDTLKLNENFDLENKSTNDLNAFNKKKVSFHEHVLEADVSNGNVTMKPIINHD